MTAAVILSIDDPQAIPAAKEIIQRDGLIAFPTDTIYGLASGAFSPQGIHKIFAAKERPEDKALPILIGDIHQLESLVLFISDTVQQITAAFWPGALTLILPKGQDIPPDLSPYPTVGVRMPDLAFTRQLLQETGPLATTSANISGGKNPTSTQDVIDQLGDRIDLILDGGSTPGPAASTVVDASGEKLIILREGPISLYDLETLIGQEK